MYIPPPAPGGASPPPPDAPSLSTRRKLQWSFNLRNIDHCGGAACRDVFFKSIQITSNANLAGLPSPQVPASSQQKLPAKLPQPIDWLPPAIRCRDLLPATHYRILPAARGNLVDKQAAIEHLGEITAVAPTSAIAAAQGVSSSSSSNSGKEEIVFCSQLRHCCCRRCTVPQAECNKTTTDNQSYYNTIRCVHAHT